MSVAWFVAKLILFAFLLSVLLRQSYNLIFFVGRRPVAWIVTVTVFGFVIVVVAAFLGSSSNLVFWAYTLAIAMNFGAAKNAEFAKEAAAVAEEIYAEMGITGGRTKYRIGLVGFALAAAVAYGLVYSEICSSGNCISLTEFLWSE